MEAAGQWDDWVGKSTCLISLVSWVPSPEPTVKRKNWIPEVVCWPPPGGTHIRTESQHAQRHSARLQGQGPVLLLNNVLLTPNPKAKAREEPVQREQKPLSRSRMLYTTLQMPNVPAGFIQLCLPSGAFKAVHADGKHMVAWVYGSTGGVGP